ncbi:anti-sigma factor [Dietzia sp. NPDC055877]
MRSHHDHPETAGGIDPADLDLYALDALPPREAEAVEEALVSAPEDQRASMFAHIASTQEVAADMVAVAGLDTAPPPALRARVLDEVAARARRDRVGGPRDDDDDDTTGDPVSGDRPGGGGSVTDLSAMRARRRPRMWTVIGAAAAAILLVAAGVGIGRITDGSSREDNLPVAAPPSGAMPEDVTMLLASDDLEITRGQVGGAGLATVLASRSADMAVISMTGLPDPAEGRAYQLWLMGDHDPIPAGTMESGEVGPSPAAQIEGISGSEQIGLTEEPAGGSPAPTGEVLLALNLD